MLRAIAIWLPAGLFLALFGLGLGFGCSDDFDKQRARPAATRSACPTPCEEVVDPSKQPEDCPESLPKEGETCPTVTQANITCRYAVRQCPNGYDVVQSDVLHPGRHLGPLRHVRPLSRTGRRRRDVATALSAGRRHTAVTRLLPSSCVRD